MKQQCYPLLVIGKDNRAVSDFQVLVKHRDFNDYVVRRIWNEVFARFECDEETSAAGIIIFSLPESDRTGESRFLYAARLSAPDRDVYRRLSKRVEVIRCRDGNRIGANEIPLLYSKNWPSSPLPFDRDTAELNSLPATELEIPPACRTLLMICGCALRDVAALNAYTYLDLGEKNDFLDAPGKNENYLRYKQESRKNQKNPIYVPAKVKIPYRLLFTLMLSFSLGFSLSWWWQNDRLETKYEIAYQETIKGKDKEIETLKADNLSKQEEIEKLEQTIKDQESEGWGGK
jgi:cell division protein FtsB